MLDRGRDRAHRAARRLLLPEVPMALIELPNLGVGAPGLVAAPCISQIQVRDLLETTRRVEARGELVGDRLVVDKAVGPRGTDSPFVQAHRVNVAALDSRDLRTDQRDPVLKVLRAMLRPDPQLTVVGGQGLPMLLPLAPGNGVARRGASQRPVEVELCRLELRWGCPQQLRGPQRGSNRGPIVAGQEARLQFSNRIPALGFRQSCIPAQTTLESQLVEPLIVEGAKLRRYPAQRLDEAELSGDDVSDEPDPSSPRKVEAMFRFPLQLTEIVSGGETVRDQLMAAVSGKGEVPGFVRHLEGTAHQLAAGSDVSRPRHHNISVTDIRSSPKAPEGASFDQFIADPTE